MHDLKRTVLVGILLAVLGGGVAPAAAAPAASAPATPVSKERLYRLLGKRVIVIRRLMPSLSGVLVAYDRVSVRLQLTSGRMTRLKRTDVTGVRGYPESKPTPDVAPLPAPRGRQARARRGGATLNELRLRLSPRAATEATPRAPHGEPTDVPMDKPVRGKGMLHGGIVAGSIGFGMMVGSGLAALVADTKAAKERNCSGGLFDYYCENDTQPDFKPAIGLLVAGSVLLGIGTPLMVVGSVRRSLSVAGAGYARTRKRWMHAGIGVTIGGLALGAGGLALSLTKERRPDGPEHFGTVMGSAGLFITLLVGLPMWISAALHPKTNPRQQPDPATAGATAVLRKPLVDRRHTQAQQARLTRGLPRTTLLSTQLRF